MLKSPEQPFYAVEDIIGRKIINSKVYYLVKWKDFSEEEATWEYSRSLPYIRPLINRFNAKVRNEKERSVVSRNSSLGFSFDDSRASLGEEVSRKRMKSSRRAAIFANSVKDIEDDSTVVGPRPGEGKSRARQRKRQDMENSKIGSVMSELSLGDQKVSFGLPDSSEEEEELKVPRFVASQPARITKRLAPGKRSPAPNKEEAKAVRRIALLQKVDETQGKLEFYVEMENGTTGVLTGKEMLDRHPKELLDYFERLIMSGVK